MITPKTTAGTASIRKSACQPSNPANETVVSQPASGAPITPEIWSDVSSTAIPRARSAAGKKRGMQLA